MKNAFLILFLFCSVCAAAQAESDSLRQTDSAPVQRRSVPVRRAPVGIQRDTMVVTRDSLVMPPPKDTISQDSLRRDSINRAKDSVYKKEITSFNKGLDSTVYNRNPFFQFKNPIRRIAKEREWNGKEGFFYSIIALLLFFCIFENRFFPLPG